MLSTLKRFILDIFFPMRCLSCGSEGSWLCSSCLKNVKLETIQHCPICKRIEQELGQTCRYCRSRSNLNGVFVVAAPHQAILRKLVHRLKYNSFSEVSETLVSIILKGFTQNFITNQDLEIIPVPLHPKREKQRGFNQSLLLGSLLGSYTNLRIMKSVLIRTRNTKSQMKLKRQQRLKNLQGAFTVQGKLCSKSSYILIDDIVTTGATLEACAKALRKAGAKEVWGLALSRGT